MPNVWSLVVIMIVTGVVGGAVSHLLIPVRDSGAPQGAGRSGAAGMPPIFRDIELYKSMVTGIAAVFLLPLFFHFINYDIMNQIVTEQEQAVKTAMETGTASNIAGSVPAREATTDFNNLMLFISYCLVAAISSKKFIQLISNKTLIALRQENEGLKQGYQELSSKMNVVMDPVTEDDGSAASPDSATGGVRLLSASPAPLPGNQNSVLQALANSRYIFRTAEGIAADCGLDSAEATETLRQLIGQRLVEQTIQAKGIRFHITAEGKHRCG